MNLSVVVLPAKVLTDGTHKVRIAMSHNGETRYFLTRFVVPSPKNVKNGKVTGKEIGNASYINLKLAEKIQEIYKAYDLIEDAECYSCSQLKELLETQLKRVTLKSFNGISAEWLEIKGNQSKDASMVLFRKGVELFKEFAGDDFLLPLLTLQYVYQYDNWLEKKGLSDTTINMRMRVLHAIVTYAVKRKYITYDVSPFEGYKERQETVRESALPPNIMRNLMELKTENRYVQVCRDCLLLSFYLCGMNLADMLVMNFNTDHVSYVRIKTRTRRKDRPITEFLIQPEAKEIIDRYITKSGTLCFDGKTKLTELNSFFTRHLDKVKEAIGYDGRLIYYSMRKTFAQTANEIGVQERVIAFCLGDVYDSKTSGSIGYYIKTTRTMADEAIRKVIDHVKTQNK